MPTQKEADCFEARRYLFFEYFFNVNVEPVKEFFEGVAKRLIPCKLFLALEKEVKSFLRDERRKTEKRDDDDYRNENDDDERREIGSLFEARGKFFVNRMTE